VRNLVAADWVRFRRRRDLFGLVLLVPVILGVMYVGEFNSVASLPDVDFFIDPPDPVLEEEFRAQMIAEWRNRLVTELPGYAFPASLLKVSGNIAPVIFLAIYLGTALVAVIEGHRADDASSPPAPRRWRPDRARDGTRVLVVAVGVVLSPVLPFYLGRRKAAAVVHRARPGSRVGRGVRVAAVLPFRHDPCAHGRWLGIGLAFLLTLLLFAGDVAITGAPVWPDSPLPWVPAVTATGSISRMLGGEASPLAAVAPASVSFVALLAWILVPILAAIAWFRRIDLNE
jgi:hypothetical protein